MSSFDAASFLDATLTDPTTKRKPIPAGLELTGIIGEPKSRSWTGKADPTKGGIAIDVSVEIDLAGSYPELAKEVGADKVTLQDSIMLDLTDAGTIDNSPGKNGKLRRYRDSLDMNKPGDAFSFRMMQGRQIKVKIGHREYQGDIFDEIASVVKA